jgi:hypothetical protein
LARTTKKIRIKDKKMDKEIYEYIKDGLVISGRPNKGYTVFTTPTQWFDLDKLEDLTPQRFQEEFQKQKEHDELVSVVFKEVQKEIDENIINQLRGGDPNPDIIPMNTTDRLFDKFMETSEGDPDIIWNKWQFIDKLLFDDEFYEKWGENCCEELSYIRRYDLWLSKNYETGMEYNPNNPPDFDNEYYEPTPKRKLK